VGIIGYQDGPDYIRTYNRIDFALDPFPFACGTTTFDALWMGVPEVALVGDCPVGRGGFSILSTLGHPEGWANRWETTLKLAKNWPLAPVTWPGFAKFCELRFAVRP